MEPFIQTQVYDLANGGDLIFERDLFALSEFLGRSPPVFYGGQITDQANGQLQWLIMANLPGKPESPMFRQIQFSLRDNNWVDGLARALQEALARLCGQNSVAIEGERFAHFARHSSVGLPLRLPFHPVLRHHVDHLDFMLFETRAELDNSRAAANHTQQQLNQYAETIKVIAKERRTLRQLVAKRDSTIHRLKAKLAVLKETVATQAEQLQILEGEGEGEDIQGDGYSYVSNDNDYEEEEEGDMDFHQHLPGWTPPSRSASMDSFHLPLSTCVLAQNNQGHGNHDHPGSKLKNFQNTNPPVFSKTEEPLDADDWLQTMENNLEVAGVEDNDKVLFATHYLAGPARAWWTSARALNAGQMMTWADFKLKFSKYHVPRVSSRRCVMSSAVKQGRLTVAEYAIPHSMEGKLNQANENRKRRMMHRVGPAIPPSSALAQRRIHPETTGHRHGCRARLSEPEWRKRRTGGHHHNSNNRPPQQQFQPCSTRAPVNTNTNTAPRTGSNVVPVTKDKSTINCYECGVVGHYSKCPKRLAKIAANTSGPAQQQRRVANSKKFTPTTRTTVAAASST
ncbi:hypothetical protein QYE76_052662 [Lolium multiflorum]|uniref:Retrotransposon gag domain-containing protein n=1 Tax=Lolium multiflorum TaxID=4521 RepID=A0AAD8SW11_LOLMU|nr:hypothetical protein QYE76_052662 [Lolium multiflorum]